MIIVKNSEIVAKKNKLIQDYESHKLNIDRNEYNRRIAELDMQWREEAKKAMAEEKRTAVPVVVKKLEPPKEEVWVPSLPLLKKKRGRPPLAKDHPLLKARDVPINVMKRFKGAIFKGEKK